MQLPAEFVTKYQEILGQEAPAFFASLSQQPLKGFRLNPLKEDEKKVAYSLAEPVPYVATGFYGAVSGHSLEHQTGYVYSQEPSAMYVGEVADVSPGEVVLDLCAAPGGKSTQIAAKLNGAGLLVSNEINHKRATILAQNLERIGAANVLILNEDPATLAHTFPGYFDKILVDAPCSGEGMFRKDPTAIKYWHKDYPAQCAARQKEILREALKMLKPGGQLIYSTCTFAPEEDEQIVAWLLTEYPELSCLPIKKWKGMDAGRPELADGNRSLENTITLFPHHFQGEGHFIAKLKDQRPAPTIQKQSGKKNKKRRGKGKQPELFRHLNAEEQELWTTFAGQMFKEEVFLIQGLRCLGNKLYWYPEEWPDISTLKFIRPGLQLGTFKKKRFEPAYSLVLYLPPSICLRKIAISVEEWKKFVAGNTLTLLQDKQENGWYLLTCEGKSFSFGKLVNGTLKNFFPKGLRFKP
ncbi:MAG: RsmF rRNA methyltransferase first C-terminal domain-containing protein [Liquorilactobacillus satsumensis]|uniref:RsmB/NOP family class I SAM-dependent RNA methyltransferase n=1 Tax=Liquorilactobacillus satsumensis TaxID=259059 RepID=UPI0039E8F2BA